MCIKAHLQKILIAVAFITMPDSLSAGGWGRASYSNYNSYPQGYGGAWGGGMGYSGGAYYAPYGYQIPQGYNYPQQNYQPTYNNYTPQYEGHAPTANSPLPNTGGQIKSIDGYEHLYTDGSKLYITQKGANGHTYYYPIHPANGRVMVNDYPGSELVGGTNLTDPKKLLEAIRFYQSKRDSFKAKDESAFAQNIDPLLEPKKENAQALGYKVFDAENKLWHDGSKILIEDGDTIKRLSWNKKGGEVSFFDEKKLTDQQIVALANSYKKNGIPENGTERVKAFLDSDQVKKARENLEPEFCSDPAKAICQAYYHPDDPKKEVSEADKKTKSEEQKELRKALANKAFESAKKNKEAKTVSDFFKSVASALTTADDSKLNDLMLPYLEALANLTAKDDLPAAIKVNSYFNNTINSLNSNYFGQSNVQAGSLKGFIEGLKNEEDPSKKAKVIKDFLANFGIDGLEKNMMLIDGKVIGGPMALLEASQGKKDNIGGELKAASEESITGRMGNALAQSLRANNNFTACLKDNFGKELTPIDGEFNDEVSSVALGDIVASEMVYKLANRDKKPDADSAIKLLGKNFGHLCDPNADSPGSNIPKNNGAETATLSIPQYETENTTDGHSETNATPSTKVGRAIATTQMDKSRFPKAEARLRILVGTNENLRRLFKCEGKVPKNADGKPLTQENEKLKSCSIYARDEIKDKK